MGPGKKHPSPPPEAAGPRMPGTATEERPAEAPPRDAAGEPGEAAEAASQESRMKEMEDRCALAEGKRDEYLALAQRVKADFDNYRRRNAGLRAEAYDDGACAFIETILPVCDNLERALGVETKDHQLRDGVALVLRQLMEALSKRGIETVDRRGETFDPALEHAVSRAEPGEGEPGTVAEVLQKGYRLGGRVLRHAMVRVVGERPEAPDGQEQTNPS